MSASARRAPLALSAVRASWGLLLLIAPAHGLLLGERRATAGERVLARVLGVRELLQAALVGGRPGRRRILAGLAVDVAHTLSMLALAARWPGVRRAVLPGAALSLLLSVLAVLTPRGSAVASRCPPACREATLGIGVGQPDQG